MVIRPSEIHEDPARARFGLGLAAEALGVECNLTLTTMWRADIDPKDAKAFLELAREEAARNGR
jgi:hypothetical protein